jgi:ribosomal protein S18 acetylase RimI-like enzyme
MLEAFEEYRAVLQPPSSSHAESVADVQRVMARGGAVLAWANATPIGSARFLLEPDHLYVGRVAVLPAFRRLGVATAMMRFLENVARAHQRLEVRVAVRGSLPSNVRLYAGLGYEVVGIEAHQRGPDTVTDMRKRL